MEDDGDVVGNCVPKVALLMSGAPVFPGVVAVISHLFTVFLKIIKAYVALSHPTELS